MAVSSGSLLGKFTHFWYGKFWVKILHEQGNAKSEGWRGLSRGLTIQSGLISQQESYEDFLHYFLRPDRISAWLEDDQLRPGGMGL